MRLKPLGYQGQAGEFPRTAAETSKLPDPKDKIEEQNLLHSAMIASDDNRTDQARRALEKVLQLDPKSPDGPAPTGRAGASRRRLCPGR